MGELFRECEVLRVYRKCDTCGEGMMIPTGVTLFSSPPKYQHECDKCGVIENYPQEYPYLYTIETGPMRELTENSTCDLGGL